MCIKEKTPKGTGGALFLLKKFVKSDFFLFNGDSFFKLDINNFYNFSKNNKNSIINIALTLNKNYLSNKKLSNLRINKKKNLLFFSKEKSKLMNAGIYYIKKSFLKIIKNEKSSLENDILPKLISKKLVSGKIYKKYFIDIGLKKNLNYAKRTFSKLNIHKCAFLDRDGVINYDYGYVGQKTE